MSVDTVAVDAVDESVMDVEEVTRSVKAISFDLLRSGAAGVRVTDDVPPLLWAIDLVMAVTGKNRNEAGMVLRRLNSDTFDSDKLLETHLSANGGKKTKLVTFEHALELIMVLPGDTAKAFRLKACDILKRHLSGDPKLGVETAHNASIGVAAACETFISDAIASAKRKREADPELGYVYGSVSDAFPGLIKIGFTCNLDARLCSLNTSCAPLPHRFVAVAPSFHPCRDERVAHAYLADQREQGEFFRMTVEELQAFFDRFIVPEYEETLKRSL